MRNWVAAFVLAVLGALQLGCASSPQGIVAPRLSVQTLIPLSAGVGGQRFRVSVLVDNPNTEPLTIRNIEFKLRLADQGILDGNSLAPMTVQALDRETMTLELSSDIISSLSRLLAFVQGPANALPYQLHGTLTLDRRLPNTFVFSVTGEVPIAMTGER